MAPRPPSPGTARTVAVHVGFACAYTLAVVVGRGTRLPGSTLALVWPAAAVAFVWLAQVWRDRRAVAAVTAAVAVLSGLLNTVTGTGPALGAVFGLANGAQAFVSCAVTHRLQTRAGTQPWRLRVPADLSALVVGSTAGAAAATCIGPLALLLLDGVPWTQSAGAWLLRNAASTFVFAALALRLGDRGLARTTPGPGRPEVLAAVVVVAAAYTVVFAQPQHLPVAFTLLPASMWIALRFRTTATAGHVLVVGVWVVTLTMAGRGPFSVGTPVTRVLLAQGFVTVVALASLVLALIRDDRLVLVAGLRRAQEESEAQAALLQTVFESTGDALSVFDARGTALLLNPAAAALFPYLAAGAPMERWSGQVQVRRPDGRPWETADLPVARALRGETVEPTDMLVRTAGAAEGLLSVGAHPLPASTGEHWAGGAVVAARDVTAERAAVARLAASERRFRAAFDTAPVGMMVVGLAGAEAAQILQVNATLCEFTGFAAWELLQLDVHALTHPDDRADCVSAFAPFLSGDVTQARQEKRYQHADGRTRWGLMSATMLTEAGWGGATGTGDEPYLLCLIEDVTARKAAERLLRHQALHDSLTGLPNRVLLRDRLTHALAAARREPAQVGVLFIDLDGFKAVNDAAGHAAGDELLQQVADRFSTCLRPEDTLARCGGDEFAVVCPDLVLSGRGQEETVLQAIADRLRECLATPFALTAGTYSVGASVGTTWARPVAGRDDADVAEAALAVADEAMYAAKRRGRVRPVPSRG
ncbi:diguanylate cyclase domain-containing protein [Kineococcus rhizosphaerae]|uniref:diguanylate cyclase domain-containing protein n=1 Tax=Kineococcus rhizosphaerae TaxID=559628 RepID=UPI0014742F94|nr:diguanylate cyclase [Kineococcus rhizosphaerae]